MQRNPINAVVFDAVGTLIYPEPGVAEVYTVAGRRFGSKLTGPEVVRRFRDVFAEVESRDRAGDLTTSEAVETSRWQQIVWRVLDDVSDHAGCFVELWRHFARASSWRVFPEVPRVLESLASRRVRLAIASNFDQRLYDIARQIGPLQACHPVLVSSQVGYRKPHPQFFEAIRTALGVASNTVLYVGDDPDNDIAAARLAGFQTLLIRRLGCDGPGEAASLEKVLQLAGGVRL